MVQNTSQALFWAFGLLSPPLTTHKTALAFFFLFSFFSPSSLLHTSLRLTTGPLHMLVPIPGTVPPILVPLVPP